MKYSVPPFSMDEIIELDVNLLYCPLFQFTTQPMQPTSIQLILMTILHFLRPIGCLTILETVKAG